MKKTSEHIRYALLPETDDAATVAMPLLSEHSPSSSSLTSKYSSPSSSLKRHLFIITSLGLFYLFLLILLFLATSHISNISLLRLINTKTQTEFDQTLLNLNDSILEKLLPPTLQLNLSETLALTEAETSNLAALYYGRWKEMKQEEKENGASFLKIEVTYSSLKFCSEVQLPPPYNLRMNNIFWQVLSVKNLKVYLLNAYYDDRLYGTPKVVSLWVSSSQKPVKAESWWCLLWFNHTTEPVLSKITELDPIWPDYWSWGRDDGVYGPLLAACKVPPELADHVPTAVSIQTVGDCAQVEKEPTNVLRVINNRRASPLKIQENEQKMSIGICVKAMRFETYDFSVRLVEWLEMVRLLGAEKVYFYLLGAQKSILKVLNYYVEKGFVDWRNSTLPGDQVNTNSLHNLFYSEDVGLYQPQEITELNDCLYRNLYRHQFVLIMDVDEVVLPVVKEDGDQLKIIPSSWQQIIAQIEDKYPKYLPKKSYFVSASSNVYEAFEVKEKVVKRSSKLKFNFKNIRFHEANQEEEQEKEPIPSYLYMMRHISRSLPAKGGSGAKAFHRTAHVTMVHNHFPLRCLNTTGYHSCKGVDLPKEDFLLYHYRRWREPPEVCKKDNEQFQRGNLTEEQQYDCAIVTDRWSAWRYFDRLKGRVRKRLVDIFGGSGRNFG